MYVSIAYHEDPFITDILKIMKKLNDGKLEVYQAYSAFEKKAYALKMFPNNSLGTRQYKKELLLSRLSHPNIIKYIPATVVSEDDSHFHCIITEFAKYGNLLDMVVDGVFTSEVLIRTYFLQVIAGLEYMHSQGVAHLDLKLENLMIGSRFDLKIIDFDQAQRIKDKKITSGGTDGYRAPEIIDGSCTNFQAADVYSLGIILYAMKAQSAPFAEVTVQDANNQQRTSLTHYCTFIKNNAAFWKGKTAPMNDPMFFSQDFKELVNGMLQFDITKRFTLNDVKNSNWFKGPTLSKEKLRAEMAVRLQLL